MNDSFYRCPTGKRIYYTEKLANRAITNALKRGEIGPLRHYECPECEHWHLATKRTGYVASVAVRDGGAA